MSADAIFDITAALAARLAAAIEGPVHVGSPATNQGSRDLALFLFHLEPNRDMRNTEYLVEPANDPTSTLVTADALPLDLRYLISVFRTVGAGPGGNADANELNVLGRAVQSLHQNPTITEAEVPDQRVRLTPEPYPMEEMSRVWGLFPDTAYQTSMVYLASPVFVSVDPDQPGRPVVDHTTKIGPFQNITAAFDTARPGMPTP